MNLEKTVNFDIHSSPVYQMSSMIFFNLFDISAISGSIWFKQQILSEEVEDDNCCEFNA